MKPLGSVAEYTEERTRHLFSCYRRYISSCSHIDVSDVFKHIVNLPAPRFFVSEQRAAIVISRILNGDTLQDFRPNKREMFLEIYNRLLVAKKEYPDMPISRLVGIVIEQPAPKSYIAPDSARAIVLKARKQWYKEKKKRPYRW